MKTKNEPVGFDNILNCVLIENRKARKARPAHFHVHTAPSSGLVRLDIFFPSSEGGVGATKKGDLLKTRYAVAMIVFEI